MSESTSQLKIGAALDGSFEQTTNTVKRKIGELGTAATDAGKSLAGMGDGGDKSAKKVEASTRNMQGQLQRLVASFEGGEKGSRKFYESLANQRGVPLASLKPLLDQLDAAKSKFKETAQASQETSSSFSGLGVAAGLAGRALAAIGIAGSLKSFITLADASTNLSSRLSLVTDSAGEMISLQGKLFSVAQASRVSFADLAGTYTQLSRSTKELGVSQSSLLGVVQTISQAVTISGGSAASAEAALMQLSQGFAAGALRGEELNSVMEQTPRLAQAIADGLGVSIGKLREMGKAGELTSEVVLAALEKSASSVASEFGKMALTVEQASTQAGNSALRLVGVIDKITGASAAASAGVSKLSSGMDSLARDIERLSSTNSLSDFFFAAFQNEETLNVELRVTQEELAKINARLAASPSNIYARSAKAEMESYIVKIKEAQDRLDRLSGREVSRDPRDQSGFASRGDGYAAEAKRQRDLDDQLNNFRLKSSGVPASYIKDMQEIIRLNQEGKLVGAEYTKALKDQQDVLLKSSGAAAASAKATKDNTSAAKEAAKALEAIHKAGDAGARAHADARNKERDGIESYMLAQTEAYAKAVKGSQDALTAAQAEYDQYGMSKSQIAEITLLKLEDQLVTKTAGSESYEAIRKQIDAQKELIGIMRKTEARTANEDAAKLATQTAADAAAEWKKTSDSINSTLTDALMRGFESGKDFARNLRDTVVNMFKTMVLRPVISAVMNPIAQGITGAMGLSGAASAANTGSSLLSAAGMASSAYSIGTTIAGMAGTAIGAATGGLVAANAATVTLLTGSASSAAAAATAAATAGGAAASAASTAAAAGSSAAASLASVALPALAVVAVLAAFGAFRSTKQTGTGISGTLGDDQSLTGFNEMRKSGYLLGGPKYWDEIKAIDPLMAKALKTDFANIKAAATGAADALGLASTEVAGFSKAFRIEFTGDKAKDEALYAGLMAGTADDLARTILGSYKETIETVKSEIASGAHWDSGESLTSIITSQVTTSTYTPSEFAKEGETASQTLARLAGSITLVNQTSDMLGNALLEVGLSGANTASLLIDAFGSAESYAANMGAYYTNFYREAERAAFLTEKTTAAFMALGLTMPTLDASAREAYRALVDTAAGQDMTVESNRKAYAALIALQGPMNELAPAFADAGDSIESFISDIVASAKSLREAISKSRFGQMDAESSLAQQQGDYSKNYSLALSTTGTTRAGYADNLASSLPDLVKSIGESSGSRADWLRATSRAYAQAETVAGLLDADASALGYAAESVTLLTSISDSATATADGMRALVTQLGGAPAFAKGGYHKGGLRLVGEDGPELEVTGPSMIYNAAQMSGLGGGSNGALLAEMQALRFEVAQLRQDNSAENRAIVTHTQKSAGVLAGIEINGIEVRTDPSEALVVEISA